MMNSITSSHNLIGGKLWQCAGDFIIISMIALQYAICAGSTKALNFVVVFF